MVVPKRWSFLAALQSLGLGGTVCRPALARGPVTATAGILALASLGLLAASLLALGAG
ncbi:MAG: hypothetical protein H0U10_15260 [Chloroflexia bacterium]|nr:hypothetical protein [Chloroflexia bacterium]